MNVGFSVNNFLINPIGRQKSEDRMNRSGIGESKERLQKNGRQAAISGCLASQPELSKKDRPTKNKGTRESQKGEKKEKVEQSHRIRLIPSKFS